MKWKSGYAERKKLYNNRTTREVDRFLIFPKLLNDVWKWWETATIKQRMEQIDVGGSCEWGQYDYMWIDVEWIDNEVNQ